MVQHFHNPFEKVKKKKKGFHKNQPLEHYKVHIQVSETLIYQSSVVLCLTAQ